MTLSPIISDAIDWGYLATHLAAVVSKIIITSYYGTDLKYAYHLGFSTGGRQSLTEAQRYPEDFNGVYLIAPALNETGITTYTITSNVRAVLLDETTFTQAITVDDVQLIQEAVLNACDDLDGVTDGVVGFPRSCNFDLDGLACPEHVYGDSSCLSSKALNAAKLLYSGSISSITNQQLNLEGVLPGSEPFWPDTYVAKTKGGKPVNYNFATSYLSHYAFWPDPKETVTPFTINLSDPTLLARTSKTESLEYAGMADMSKFQQLGGKIIMTQGLSDTSVAPNFALDLYRRSEEMFGAESIREWFRFFEIPGGRHGRGGVGAETFYELDYLVRWVEKAEAPDTIVAIHYENGSVTFTRQLFFYPYLAEYKGYGDKGEWENSKASDAEIKGW